MLTAIACTCCDDIDICLSYELKVSYLPVQKKVRKRGKYRYPLPTGALG